MNDIATDPSVERHRCTTLAELERRVQALEAKVAAIPDARANRRTHHRTREGEHAAAAAADRSIASRRAFRDIAIPIPSVQTVVDHREDDVGRLRDAERIAHALLDAVRSPLSHGLAHALHHDRAVDHDPDVALVVRRCATTTIRQPICGTRSSTCCSCLILFLVLSFETRRYKEWRSKVDPWQASACRRRSKRVTVATGEQHDSPRRQHRSRRHAAAGAPRAGAGPGARRGAGAPGRRRRHHRFTCAKIAGTSTIATCACCARS